MAGPCASLHVNEGPGRILRVLAGARAYLHASKEMFGIAAAEAVAARCVPVVPDSSAHAETVPFAGLRYGAEDEAVSRPRTPAHPTGHCPAAVRRRGRGRLQGVDALDGRYDRLPPGLRDHVRRFSEAAFQEQMIGIIEGRE